MAEMEFRVLEELLEDPERSGRLERIANDTLERLRRLDPAVAGAAIRAYEHGLCLLDELVAAYRQANGATRCSEGRKLR